MMQFFPGVLNLNRHSKSAALPNFIKTSVVKLEKREKSAMGEYEPENRLLVLVHYFIKYQETPVHNNSSVFATTEPSRKNNRTFLKLGTEDKQLIVLNEFNWHSFRYLFLFGCLFLLRIDLSIKKIKSRFINVCHYLYSNNVSL